MARTHIDKRSQLVSAAVGFMPGIEEGSSIVRLVVGERGRVAMRTDLAIRFGYGDIVPWMTRLDDGSRRAIAGPDMVVVRTTVPLRGEDFTTVGEFTVDAGETVPFSLTYAASHLPPPAAQDPLDQLRATEKFWLDWTATSKASGPSTEAVNRSLITMKALTYARTGGIVAAPTTSLPERIGGPRNWDYRFCWLIKTGAGRIEQHEQYRSDIADQSAPRLWACRK